MIQFSFQYQIPLGINSATKLIMVEWSLFHYPQLSEGWLTQIAVTLRCGIYYCAK